MSPDLAHTSPTPQTITLIKDDNNASARFQVVPQNPDGASPIQTFSTQGEVISWLLRNGYKWVKDSQPQVWTKP
jgi:hypothetical protein